MVGQNATQNRTRIIQRSQVTVALYRVRLPTRTCDHPGGLVVELGDVACVVQTQSERTATLELTAIGDAINAAKVPDGIGRITNDGAVIDDLDARNARTDANPYRWTHPITSDAAAR